MHKARKLLGLVLALALLVVVLGVAGCSQAEQHHHGRTRETPTLTTVEAGKLLIGSDTAFPPFESMNGTTPEGFDVDLGQAIADELGS